MREWREWGNARGECYNFINFWHALKSMPWTSFVVSEFNLYSGFFTELQRNAFKQLLRGLVYLYRAVS
jgi:hypothetical protein